MTLATELADQQAATAEAAPAAVLDTLDRSVALVDQAGIADTAIGVGDRAPDVVLPNATGTPIDLSELRTRGPVVVSFYRGGWCPYCNLELRALQGVLGELNEAGATLVAVSPQTPDESLSTRERAELDFEVLSDADSEVIRRFGLVYTVDEPTRAVLSAFGNDLEQINGTDTWELPVPATYVIDRDGTVVFAFVDPDYRRRAEPNDVVEAVRAISEN